MSRVATGLAVLVASLLTSACFESETLVKVKKDGSGTVEIKSVLGAQMAGMMAMGAQNDPDFKDPLTDEGELKKNAAKMGEGVEFVGVKKLKFDDGRQGAVATYKFADVNKLRVAPGEAPGGDEGDDEPKKKEDMIGFKFAPGKLTVMMPKEGKKAAEEAKEEEKTGDDEPNVAEGGEDAAAMAMMAPMMQGMRIALKVSVDGEITKTNATHKEGSTVTLMDIDMGKLMSNPEVMKKMKSPDDMKDFKAFSKIAKGAGATIEPEEKIEIEFK